MNFRVLIIIISLLFSAHGWAITPEMLSESELNVIKQLGYSESDLRAMDAATLRSSLEGKISDEKENFEKYKSENFQRVIDQDIKPKLDDVGTKLGKEGASLKGDLPKLGGAYLVSTISLFMAALIAPQALMVCKTKPSAMIYAGSAAVYIFQEMRNVKKLKASQLAEIEMISKPTIDQNKSINQNVHQFNDKIDDQINYIQVYKNTIDQAIKALRVKAKNAKMVSIGFLAASAAAAAEQMNWISGSGSCVASTNHKTHEPRLPWQFSLLNNSWASEGEDSKKLLVAPQLKDNKAADWLGDLDKLGIAGGLAINVVAHMASWQMGFLKSIISNGTSRSIAFGVQGALAFSAGLLFEKAAQELEEKMNRVDLLLNNFQKDIKKSIGSLVPSIEDARHLQKIATALGLPSDKLITDMSINEASVYIQKLKDRARTLDQAGKELLEKFEQYEKLKKSEGRPPSPKEDDKTSYLDWLLPRVYAAKLKPVYIFSRLKDLNCIEKNSCPVLSFPELMNPQTKSLAQYLNLYESYYQGIRTKNVKSEALSTDGLERFKPAMKSFRDHVFRKGLEKSNVRNTNYSSYENLKLTEERKSQQQFFNKLSKREKQEADVIANPLSFNQGSGKNTQSQKKTAAKTNLTAQEWVVVGQLISRLEASEPKKNGPDMNFVTRENSAKNSPGYDYGNIDIHSKESSLFEVIHLRYLKFIKNNFPEY